LDKNEVEKMKNDDLISKRIRLRKELDEKISELMTNPKIENIAQALRDSRPITKEEKEDTKKFMDDMEKKKSAEVTQNQKILYVLGKTMKENGLDMVLSKTKAIDDATIRLHAQLLLNGDAFDLKVYNSKFENCRYSADELNKDEKLRKLFIEEFKIFLKDTCSISPEDITVIDIKSDYVYIRYISYVMLDQTALNGKKLPYGPCGSQHAETTDKSIIPNK
jgi:hypothetical protein